MEEETKIVDEKGEEYSEIMRVPDDGYTIHSRSTTREPTEPSRASWLDSEPPTLSSDEYISDGKHIPKINEDKQKTEVREIRRDGEIDRSRSHSRANEVVRKDVEIKKNRSRSRSYEFDDTSKNP